MDSDGDTVSKYELEITSYELLITLNGKLYRMVTNSREALKRRNNIGVGVNTRNIEIHSQ